MTDSRCIPSLLPHRDAGQIYEDDWHSPMACTRNQFVLPSCGWMRDKGRIDPRGYSWGEVGRNRVNHEGTRRILRGSERAQGGLYVPVLVLAWIDSATWEMMEVVGSLKVGRAWGADATSEGRRHGGINQTRVEVHLGVLVRT
jgi:hypothetical protein